MEYTVDLVREPNPADDMVDGGGAKVYVNPQAMLFLLGTEMDYEVDQAPLRVRLPQPEPDLVLRLRRIGRDPPRRPGGAGRGAG